MNPLDFFIVVAVTCLMAVSSASIAQSVEPNSAQVNDQLLPFSSDGCSSFPDGTFQQKELWLSCCVAHDKAYWKGGTYQQRQVADDELQRCVADTGQKEIAALMKAGVRVGGSPFWPTSYRWGYGWQPNRGYLELSPSELNLALSLLKQYEQTEIAQESFENNKDN